MGQCPIKILKKFCPKSINPILFRKSPIQDKPRIFLHNLEKSEKIVKKHTFEEILQRFELEIDGFWVEINLGLRKVRVRQREGTEECFKNLSHQPYKTENTHFSRVRYSRNNSQKTHLKHKAFRRKLLVTKQSRDNHKSLYLKFCVFQFLP